ncbi:MAG: hypothetical protein IKS05_09875 [Oscillospiraceae bacterium]|nr:hypothetical protein [Oscillospiraceae bacterium]
MWFAIIAGLAILGGAIWYGMKQHNKLVGEGKIISRRTNFMESAEIFTLNPPDPAAVTAGVKAFDYSDMHTSMKGSSEKQFYQFTGGSFGAKLAKQADTPEGKAVYRFEFTNWKTHNGMPRDAMDMNKLTTAVEKLFVSLDPNTQVSTQALEFKTKHSIL